MKKRLKIFSLIFLTVSTIVNSQTTGGNYVTTSVLSSGKWFKIAVTADGIYRLDYETLRNLGLDNPSNPRLYSNNKGQLSYYNDNSGPDDLKETAIWLNCGADNVFKEGDYLLFYGQGPHRWVYNKSENDFDFVRDNYSDTAFYFITSGTAPGKRISIAPVPASPVNHYSRSSDALYFHEIEYENLIHSGREWYEPFPPSGTIAINPGFGSIDLSEPVKYSVRVLSRASGSTNYTLTGNGSTITSIDVNGINLASTTGTYAEIENSSGSAFAQTSDPSYSLQFHNNGETSALGFLDYVRLHARKWNLYTSGVNFYTDAASLSAGNTTQFSIRTTSDNITIWDVTDPCNNEIIQYNKSGDSLIFRSITDTLRTFAVFQGNHVASPLIIRSVVPNQDLHASGQADMIIVSHPEFMKQALELSDLHEKEGGLSSIVVTPQQIYNEFSGGTPDIAAIRNFVRMKYLQQKNTSRPLKYLLLFGDGSYENKTPPPGNPCFIPTYQSQNSNIFVSSFTSDDFYGMLEDGEGEDSGNEDIGVGRIPAADTTEAVLMVSKIKRYIDPASNGDWKNIVCLTADDEDNNEHMINAEGLASLLADSVPWINVDKIYFDAYPQTTTATGQFYPGVTQAINDRINSGALIFNYIGHGNESSLGHERVVTMETIDQWKNKSNLPLFVTATCEFSRFDDIITDNLSGKMTGKNSAGEKILLSSDNGGIALMSTTRLVYSAPNYALNRNILDAAFHRDGEGKSLRLGDIIRIAKNMTGEGSNKRNFLLLGDPALRLSYPWHGRVVTDSIIDAATGLPCDTVRALSLIRIKGHIEDLSGSPVTGFNGHVKQILYGKPSEIITLANDGGPKMNFSEYNNILFSGNSIVSNGKFETEFLVPREIDYSYGRGRLSYYAYDEKSDMEGLYDSLIIGGFNNNPVSDTSGPRIDLYLNDTLFTSGGITDKNPRLYARIYDIGGINSTGAGIGHDLECWLDGDRKDSFILNSYFTSAPGNYTKGSLIYQLQGLAGGRHTITMKAWDNFNNSSERSIEFLVKTGESLILSNLTNYPNPFTGTTRISVQHNRPDENLKIRIDIFNLEGDLVRVIQTSEISQGYELSPIIWDGTSSNGRRLDSGIYPYRVTISSETSGTSTVSGRMIIL